MKFSELVASLGAALAVLMTVVEVSPIKVDPWKWLLRFIGNAINGDVLKKLAEIEESNQQTKTKLENHIKKDDERTADGWRQRILRFNDELKRGLKHTEEHYNETLEAIDKYEAYCRDHEDYKNSKAVHAISNIERVYDDRLKNNDFL